MEKISLQEFKKQAYNAFRNTYFDPDKTAQRTITDHEDQLNGDLLGMPDSEHETYIKNYKQYFSSWLNSHANCASSAITGGAKFDTGRAERANEAERKKYEALVIWREKTLKAIARRIEEAKPEEQKFQEEWQRLKESLADKAKTIKEINDGVNIVSYKPLYVKSIFKKVELYARVGDTRMVKMAVGYINELNVMPPKHKFWKLVKEAEDRELQLSEQAARESTKFNFKGGKVINNFKENRLQISFDSKPSGNIIESVKHHGFRWSPSQGVWQRIMTGNAVFDCKRFLQSNDLYN